MTLKIVCDKCDAVIKSQPDSAKVQISHGGETSLFHFCEICFGVFLGKLAESGIELSEAGFFRGGN